MTGRSVTIGRLASDPRREALRAPYRTVTWRYRVSLAQSVRITRAIVSDTIVNRVGPAVHAPRYSAGSENTEARVGMRKLVILAIMLSRSSRSCTEWNRQSEVCHRL